MLSDSTVGIIIGILIGLVVNVIILIYLNAKTHNQCEDINFKIGALDNTSLVGLLEAKIGTLENTTLSGQNNMILNQIQVLKEQVEKINQRLNSYDNRR